MVEHHETPLVELMPTPAPTPNIIWLICYSHCPFSQHNHYITIPTHTTPMSVIDVTNHESKHPGFLDNLKQYWDVGFNRFFWDHVKRGLQLGAVFGTAVVLPYTIFSDLRKLRALSLRRILYKQAASLTLGLFFSLGWMMVRYASWSNK